MKSRGYVGRAQWDPGFFVYVAVALIGMTLWSLIDPRKTVETHGRSLVRALVRSGPGRDECSGCGPLVQTSSFQGDRISRESMALPFSARGPTKCWATGSQLSGMPSRSAIAPMWQTETER